ncbi:MAG: HAD family phosphatase [Candidatus Aminicenantes bacterium]|nr:HAD family phosphatase [Candidatus Aminicenantes bacterium]
MKGLIFDMDGLMIDSERLYFQAERELAFRFGKVASDALLGRMMGRKGVESMEIFVRELGLPLTSEEALALRTPIMRRLLAEDLRPMPGLGHILDAFFGRLKMAVATGASRKLLDIVVDRLGIREKFDLLLPSDSIKKGKPDPEIFLAACNGLGLPPAACVVLEDSENGALAGKRAGCHVVAVPSEYSRHQDFGAADIVVPDLFRAEEHIQKFLVSSAPPAF